MLVFYFQTSGMSAAPPDDSPPDQSLRPEYEHQSSNLCVITQDAFTQLNDKRINKKHHRNKKVRNSAYLNRVIKYLGEKRAGLESDAKQIAKEVEDFVRDLIGQVERLPVQDDENDRTPSDRFRGEIIPCGSYYEGVKVKQPNEFDYLFALDTVPFSTLDITHVNPQTFKPYKNSEVRAKSYYSLNFSKSGVPEKWWCDQCHGCKSATGKCTRLHLEPRQIQSDFRNKVRKVACGFVHPSGTISLTNPVVTANGPAVTLYAKIEPRSINELLNDNGKKRLKSMGRNYAGFLIKIDISLAIPMKRYGGTMWPLQDISNDAELNTEMVGAEPIETCYLVPSGDFWRASFSHLETQEMKNNAGEADKKSLFQALKVYTDKDFYIVLTFTGLVDFLYEEHKQKPTLQGHWRWNFFSFSHPSSFFRPSFFVNNNTPPIPWYSRAYHFCSTCEMNCPSQRTTRQVYSAPILSRSPFLRRPSADQIRTSGSFGRCPVVPWKFWRRLKGRDQRAACPATLSRMTLSWWSPIAPIWRAVDWGSIWSTRRPATISTVSSTQPVLSSVSSACWPSLSAVQCIWTSSVTLIPTQ